MTKTNDWDSLGLSNNFLFGKVMSDPELCKELLGLILPELQIDRIEYPELQKPIRPDVDARSVRLDVYVKDNKNTVYDIEMQTVNTGELPKRSRYYQGMIDLQLIDAGQSYKKLNHSYVIFICLADIFGLGLHKYTFENICLENTSLKLKDGAVKIFLNTESSREDVSDGLRSFLDYVAGRKAENSYVQKLENAVREAKQNREWRHEYMTLLMRDLENLEKGREEGRKEGIKEGKIQQAKDTALTLKNMGLSIEQIATAVKTNIDTVSQWFSSHEK